MSTEKIAAPSEGVESLRAAKKIVSANGVTPSHILDAVIKVHIAAEKLLRNYLAAATDAPQEVRQQAMDFGAMNFPALVRAMVDHGKPSLKKWESELLSLNATRNQHAHASGTGTTKRDVLRFISLTEDIYQQYSGYLPAAQSAKMNQNQPLGLLDLEDSDPGLVESRKWPVSVLDCFSGMALPKDKAVVFFENDADFETFQNVERVKPSRLRCNKFALVQTAPKSWSVVVEDQDLLSREKWVIRTELVMSIAISQSSVAMAAREYASALIALKATIRKCLAGLVWDLEVISLAELRDKGPAKLTQELTALNRVFTIAVESLHPTARDYNGVVIDNNKVEAARERAKKEAAHKQVMDSIARGGEQAAWLQVFNQKVAELQITKAEQLAAIELTNAIFGKEDAYLAARAAKSPEEFITYVKSKHEFATYARGHSNAMETLKILTGIWHNHDPAGGGNFFQFNPGSK